MLRFSPTLREVSMSSEAADSFVAKVIDPVLRGMQEWAAEPIRAPATERRDLCAACPMAKPCSEIYPDRLADWSRETSLWAISSGSCCG